jgi:OOP family OmpA-OmpF porin
MRQNTLTVLSLAALLSGCATKNYVRENVAPVQSKLDQVAQQVSQQGTDLQQTRQDVQKNATAISAIDEKSTAAGRRADDAMNAANHAQQTADRNSLEINQLRGVIANIDDYKVIGETTFLFPVNSAKLDYDYKQQLDQIVSNSISLKRYFVAVVGFTDQTGSAGYNLELSKRRADAVVQYLVGQGKLPFYQIRTIGMGEQELVDGGVTSEARSKSRRVDVRIYSADVSRTTAANSN